ncbi:NADH-quinone oxidoreductase subunit N [Reichenbachiella sp. MALMAid0571]|uniref:NADH-quinone oxidoreductase subunit N n=1 Tax=Reichenbachiella sp. MALMAid0571 TaxID=3143939 RepID=UPI0032E05700
MGVTNQVLTEKLNEVFGGVAHLLPELCLVSGALVILILELVLKKDTWKLKTGLSVVFIALAFGSLFIVESSGLLFGSVLIADELSFTFQVIFLFTFLISMIFPSQKWELRKMGEYHFLIFCLVLGAFLMVKSKNLLIFYLALELISISSYILTSIGFNKKGFEAGIKYLLFGALASGVMLYGMSLLYGLSGSLDLLVILSGQMDGQLHLIAVFLLVVGVLFKLSLVPMHIWTPDVYEAAPVSVVAVFSVIPKLAALVFLFRTVSFISDDSVQIMVVQIISWLAVISMFIGNLGAIWQNNAKRMMAYSSIAHAGFLVIGVIVQSEFGLQSVIFYSVVYSLMNLGVFYLIACMEKNDLYQITDYRGVGKIIPVVGISMVVFMISLTGLPPTGGFSAKFLLFSALWSTYETSQLSFLLWLFIFGLINTVIALFYYLKIPYMSIFKTQIKQSVPNITLKNKIVLALISFLILVLFFKADLLFDLTNKYSFVFSILP